MQEYSVKHVAIIPDGNRRWARARGLASWFGHKAGVEAYEKVLQKAFESGVYCLSFWGMSTDNIEKRSGAEVKFLFEAFADALSKALKSPELKKHDVRTNIIGEWRERFPKKLVELGEKLIAETRERKKHIANFLMCYDGKSEMCRAFEAARSSERFESPKEFLWTRDLPPVDLVIRTGGDPHLSAGFMMWDVADSQLHFSEKLWPDFTPADFETALSDFLARERRFGA